HRQPLLCGRHSRPPPSRRVLLVGPSDDGRGGPLVRPQIPVGDSQTRRATGHQRRPVTLSRDRTVPDALTGPARLVNRRLGQLLDREIERWGTIDRDLGDLMTTLGSAVLSGGKRLRAAFCYWAFVGCGGEPDDPRVIDAGS